MADENKKKKMSGKSAETKPNDSADVKNTEEKAEESPKPEENAVPEGDKTANADDTAREDKIKLIAAMGELDKKTAELASLNDRYLRMAAEYDNYKKRTIKEKEELTALSRAELLKQLLPVFDNIDRAAALASNPAGTDAEKLAEGVALTHKLFLQALDKIGIKEIDALDKPFDPHLCEAIFHVDDETKPENTVCEIIQKGYTCSGKVIRHALVKVAN